MRCRHCLGIQSIRCPRCRRSHVTVGRVMVGLGMLAAVLTLLAWMI